MAATPPIKLSEVNEGDVLDLGGSRRRALVLRKRSCATGKIELSVRSRGHFSTFYGSPAAQVLRTEAAR